MIKLRSNQMKNNNWQEKKLGNIATFINGKAFKPSDWSDAGLPIIRIQNLTNSIDDIHYYNGDIEEKYRITTGDILISWSATIDVFEWLNGDAVLNQHIFKVVFDKEPIDKTFFKHLIKQKIDEMLKNVHGSTMKHITKGDFDNINVLLPSLDEQKKIAKILDKADEIRAKKKLANDKLDEFLKSTFISIFGNPETNDKHWGTGTIRDIVKEAKYGTSSKAGSEGTYPILRMGNLTYEGAITLDDLKYIDLKDNELEKYLVKQGDILFNRTNSKELVGKTAVYRYEQPMAFAGYLVRVRTNEKANAEFLSAFMNSDYMKRILQLKCKNIVGMANINAQELQDFNIYIPPMELQNKFAKIVEHVEAQKQKNELVIEQMNNLFNYLSQRAFKGEL